MSAHRLITQTGVQLAGKLASIGLGVATVAIMTRALGQAGYGAYATIIAYLQLFGIAVDLGLNVLGPQLLGAISGRGDATAAMRSPSSQRDEGEQKERSVGVSLHDPACLLSNIFTLRLTVATIAFAVAAGIAFLIPQYSIAVRLGIAAATFSFIGIVLTQILQAPFQVAQRMLAPTLAEVAGRIVLVGLVAWAAATGAGLLFMVWATVAGNLAMFSIAFLSAQRIVRVRLAFDAGVWRALLTQSWPIALSIVFNLVYLRADQVLLSLLRTPAEVGLYAAPYRLLDVVTQVPHLAMGLALPLLAAAWVAGDRAAFARRTQRMVDGLAFLGIPMVIGSIVLGTPIMRFIAGAEFDASGPILGVLALALVGIFLGQPFGYAVVAVGAQRRMLWGYAVVAVVTLIGYLFLIPRFSYWGAAWMTVVSECTIALITWRVVRAASGVRLSARIPLATLVAALVMAVALILTPQLPVIPRAAGGAFVYALATLAMPWTRALVTSFRT